MESGSLKLVVVSLRGSWNKQEITPCFSSGNGENSYWEARKEGKLIKKKRHSDKDKGMS